MVMAFTSNNNLENQVEGQADWDTGLNANFTVIDRGFHGRFTAGIGISSGAILWAASGGIVLPYNSRSLALAEPVAMSYKAVNSGEADYFLLRGIVTSIGVWSGNIVAGRPVFVSPSTAGFAVSSYSAAAYAAGIAISGTGIYFAPGQYSHRELITNAQSLGGLAVGSTHGFTLNIGNRGLITRVEGITSWTNWTMKFFSGSAKVSSELLFETVSGGTTSSYLLDAAGFPYRNTDTASPGIIFGSVLVSSGVSSGYISLAVTAERFR
jgi:hypothetical protein